MKSKKHFRNVALAISACALILGILLVDSHKTLYHFREVDPGRLYRSGTLSERGLKRVARLTGIKTIVNLRAEREYAEDGGWHDREKSFAMRNDIMLVDIPMEPDTPPTQEQMRKFLDLATSDERTPVLVHCAQGVVRTGMMVAAYEVAVKGQESAKVLERLDWFGHSLDKRPQVRDFILRLRPAQQVTAS